MICKKCGKELPDDAKFCGVCGTSAASLSEFTTPYMPPVQQPSPSDQPDTEYRQTNAVPPIYTPPVQATPSATGSYPQQQTALDAPLSMGQFMLMQLSLAVPVLNLVLLMIWSFGANTNTNRKNWARSSLIWIGISMAAMILLLITVVIGNV